ncbi:MAG TPA: P1 family peptidase [Solirubrobacteraceae bacterium]|jgi:L-aminopeptidase/D-esterase-like protein|nr:P1 family peptidase [Solirubrobacteraceae bacterium]
MPARDHVNTGRGLPGGISAGHWTDPVGRTGCTVVLAPDGAVGGVDVRGAAPATLGTDALRPGTLVDRVHAILLTGGSAFGLEAAGGIMRYLEEHEVGYELASVRVPIVAGAVIFDLPVGDPRARPDRDAGYAACAVASPQPEVGAVGAGTGASVAKGGDGSQVRPGGVGLASAKADRATVAAVMVVNSVGGIWDDERHEWVADFAAWDRASALVPGTNTTIGVLATDAALTKEQANRLATVAHDGIARAIRPAHTMYDGDTMFCLATGAVPAPYDAVEAVGAELVARAIVAGVRAGGRCEERS